MATPATDMTDHDVEVNGIRLHYVAWGVRARGGRVALLIHGLTSNSQAWSGLGPRLAAQGWSVLAPDLRGRGRSDKPAHGYGIPYHAHDLLALCDVLDLPTVSLVGHSLGAQIALFLAALHPRRVDALVLGDAGGTLPADTMQAIAASLGRLGTVYADLAAYLQAMQRLPVHGWDAAWERYYRYDAHVREDGTVTSRVPKAAIAEEVAVNGRAMRLEDLPADVRAPTLIVRAALGLLAPDRGFILTAEEAARVHDTIAGSRLVEIPGANHYSMLFADAFGGAVLAFLGERPGG